MAALASLSLSQASFFQRNEADTPKKDCLDHLQDCFDNRDDLNDYVVDPIAHLLDWASHLSLDDPTHAEIKRIRTGVDIVASALSIPAILDHLNKFKRHIYALKDAWSDPQDRNVSHLFKKTTLDVCNIANNVSETTIFLHNVELIDLKESFPLVDGFYQVSNLVVDGWDLVNQVEKVQKYQDNIEGTNSKSTKEYFEKKKGISYLNIARDIFSIGLSVIGIISIIYGAMIQSLFFLPPLALTLSTIYLVLSIITYISKKSLEEQKKPDLLKV